MRKIALILLNFFVIANTYSSGDTPKKLSLNDELKNNIIKRDGEILFSIALGKNKLYKISVLQIKIDLVVQLLDSTKKVIKEVDSPNGPNGPEEFDETASYSGNYYILVKGFDDPENTPEGNFNILVTEYTPEQIEFIKKEKLRKETAVQNSKAIETVDVYNFWKAFDLLKKATSLEDTLTILKTNYFDKASGGLVEAIDLLKLTPKYYATLIASKPKYFNSIRKNSEGVANYTTSISELNAIYKQLYKNFIPYKVAFIVGPLGGADVFTSKHFVIVNCETVCHTNNVDVSELSANLKEFIVRENDPLQQIIERVGHEATHFQQRGIKYNEDKKCPLLNGVIVESICDYMATRVTKKPVVLRKDAYDYYDKNETQVWENFKKDMCNPNPGKWLFNPPSNGLPGNLGFAVGVKIVTAYYNKAKDKQQAIVEIMEMTNPTDFLEKSGYLTH
jgi:hypothetical protein